MAQPLQLQYMNQIIADRLKRAAESDPLSKSTYARDIKANSVTGNAYEAGTPPAVTSFLDMTQVGLPDPMVDIRALGTKIKGTEAYGTASSKTSSLIDSITGVVSPYARKTLDAFGNVASMISQGKLYNGPFDGSNSHKGGMFSSAAETPNMDPETGLVKDPHTVIIAEHQAKLAEARAAMENGGQPSDRQSEAIATEIGIKVAQQNGADTGNPDIFAQIKKHAQDMLNSVPPAERIDMLAAGLGILSGMANRQAPAISVISAGLQQGIDAAARTRNQDVATSLAAQRGATDIAQVQASYDAARAGAESASLRYAETVRHNKAIEARKSGSGAEAGMARKDKQLHEELTSMLSTLNLSSSGEPLNPGETEAMRNAGRVFPYFKAMLDANPNAPRGEVLSAAIARSDAALNIKTSADKNFFRDTSDVDADRAPRTILGQTYNDVLSIFSSGQQR